MEERIEKIEDKLMDISYKLDFLNKSNEVHSNSFEVVNSTIKANTGFAKTVLEKFEIIELNLKTSKTEIETLNVEIGTLKILIESINLRLDRLEK